MPKLFDILDAQTPAVPTPAQVARDRWYQVAAGVRTAIKDGVTAIARDANVLGLNAVLAEMPPEVAAQFAGLIPILKTLWESATDAVPFPDLPADPPQPESSDIV